MKTIQKTIIFVALLLMGYTTKALALGTPRVQEIQQSGTTVTVTGNSVRLRVGPGLDYDFLKWSNGTARCPKKGEKLNYLGESGDWYKVSYAGQTLYIFKQYAKLNGAATAPTYKVQITGTGVRLRFGPGLDYGYLVWENGATRSPEKGEKLTYLGEEGDWYKVSYAGSEFYVFKSYAKLVK